MKNLDELIKEYCSLNNLKYREFKEKCLETGFNIIRFGSSPIDKFRMENKIENDDTKEKPRTVVENEKRTETTEDKRQEEKEIKRVEKDNVEVKEDKKPKKRVRIIKR